MTMEIEDDRPASPPGADSGAPHPDVDWLDLVERIRCGDPSGMTDLYALFSRGVRFYLCRQLGPQELDDKVHDTFLIVVQAIRRGELREPERLMGFVRTIVRRQVAPTLTMPFTGAGSTWSWTSAPASPTAGRTPSGP